MAALRGRERDGVLWLVRGLGLGGAEKLLAMHAREGDHSRFRYHAAYAAAAKTHFVPELTAAGVQVHHLAGPSWRWLAEVRALVARQRIGVVHAHSPALAAVARTAVATLPLADRPALVTTEHNDWGSFRPLTRWANSLTYARDAHTFAVSEQVRASVRSGRRDGVEVLVHGIRPGAVEVAAGTRQRTRAALGIAPEEVVAVTVANFRPEKAHGDLLLAARQVARQDPRVRFLLVGQGPLHEEVVRRRDELALGGAVRVLGARDDVPDLLSAADVFVLASLWEGFPIAVMEALAAGLPVVATRVGGVASVVRDGVQGLLVPPAEPDRLAQAVLRVAADRRLREAMAAAALRTAPEFDIRRAVRRIESVYSELVAGGDASPA